MALTFISYYPNLDSVNFSDITLRMVEKQNSCLFRNDAAITALNLSHKGACDSDSIGKEYLLILNWKYAIHQVTLDMAVESSSQETRQTTGE
jgi:hypothetical protein